MTSTKYIGMDVHTESISIPDFSDNPARLFGHLDTRRPWTQCTVYRGFGGLEPSIGGTKSTPERE
jgi:hypothetical protein